MALGSGNWSVAGATATGTTGKLPENTYIRGKLKQINLKLTMAASGWPAAGIAMPTAASVGLIRNLDMYQMSPAFYASGVLHASRGVAFVLASGGKTMRCVRTSTVSGAPGAGVQTLLAATQILTAAQTFYVTALGW